MKKVYLIATLVAIIAGIATYFFATQIEQNTKIKDAPTKSVVVAIEDIPENTEITPEMVTVKLYIAVSVVGNSAEKLEDVLGKRSKFPIVVGEQLIKSKLFKVGEDSNNVALSYQLKKGEYAYTIAVDPVQSVASFISEGDFVDILQTGTVNAVITTSIFMRNIRVLKISDYAANYAVDNAEGSPITSYGYVTVVLNEKQIIDLTQKQAVGRIRLVLKSIVTNDEVKATTNPVETTKAG